MNRIWFGLSALRQKVLDELIMDVFTSSKQSSKQTKKQTRIWPKRLFREIPSDEKLDQQQSENLIGWTLTPLDQHENVTTPRHFMWQTATEPTEWVERSTGSYCEEHVFLEISLHKHEQQLADTLLHLHSHTEKSAQREEPKIISSRHSASEVCQMNSSPTSPVTQHTDQQTNQTNQKHESKIRYWDTASGQDLCENNLHARTWAYQLLQLSTSQTTQHKNSNTHERIICILQNSHDPS